MFVSAWRERNAKGPVPTGFTANWSPCLATAAGLTIADWGWARIDRKAG